MRDTAAQSTDPAESDAAVAHTPRKSWQTPSIIKSQRLASAKSSADFYEDGDDATNLPS